jgi:hypothetical protein
MNKADYKGFVYEWTNTINGKKYIGSHIGYESDNYIGSGVEFRKELKAFGVNSFTRKILEYVNEIDDLVDAEKKHLEKVNAKENTNYYNKTNGSSVSKKEKHIHSRGLCVECTLAPQAINYIDPDGVQHYRSKCAGCIRKGKKLRLQPPAWVKSGYKKPERCEMCGFKAKIPAKQLFVYHVDGDLKNNNWHNLKTVCANCRIELGNSRLGWKPATILPDF